MNEIIKEFKENVISHYMEGDTWDLNVNPDWRFEGRKYSPEEELVLTLYVQEEMPYLELYEQNGEIKFRKIGEIPVEDQLVHYKLNYFSLRDQYYSLTSELQMVMNRY